MSSRLRRPTTLLLGCALVAAVAAAPASAGVPEHPRKGVARTHLWTFVSSLGAPTTAQCRQQLHIKCYQPFQLHRAYDLNPLYSANLDGTGTTIALVDSFGSPRIRQDLAAFDGTFGLPAPPSLKIIRPSGPIPPYHASPDRVGWALETTLDVEWAHAMAPGASLLLVETPVGETQGLRGLPQIIHAENYVINHGLADVISQSFGTSEADFPSHARLRQLRSAFKNAVSRHVTMLASSGDTGTTGYTLRSQLFTHRAPQWPASDPLVTAVGGTRLNLNASGGRVSPDAVWNDTFDKHVVGRTPVPTAAGSGLSGVFARPAYQHTIHAFSSNHRAYPDVSLSAAVNGGVLVFLSFGGLGAGFYIVGGTSEASPEFAGIVAIADQAVGHRLGFLDPVLYQLHRMHSPALVDVTAGNNTVRFKQGGRMHTVVGYKGKTGFDLASGLGTIDANGFVNALANP